MVKGAAESPQEQEQGQEQQASGLMRLPPRVLEAEAHAPELAAVRQQARAQREATRPAQ